MSLTFRMRLAVLLILLGLAAALHVALGHVCCQPERERYPQNYFGGCVDAYNSLTERQ
jgi:hypothetical protein